MVIDICAGSANKDPENEDRRPETPKQENEDLRKQQQKQQVYSKIN